MVDMKSVARHERPAHALHAEQRGVIDAALARAGGYLPAALVQEIMSSGISIDDLMSALIPYAQEYAIPPISSFKVGAVALGSSGSLYFGANFEYVGEALSMSVHGEQAATAHAISYGETGLQKLAVSAAPCGYCRQFLYEITTASALSVLVPKGTPTPLTTLLPAAFGPSDLGVTAALMSPQAHGLVLAERATEAGCDASSDEVVDAALAAANASYAPYSFAYAGVALKTKDGAVYTGSYAENAAYNPSMSPLEAALVSLVIRGHASYGELVDAVLVQASGAKASQLDVTRAVLRSISNVELRVRQASPPTR
ncbi:cytidine deaminase [Sorangium sp. So ce388]|uniref:cytidine deaminase n=1 Tax=Sorangium sp. So ce388 TaxID=3133309 RepID=UPI003F5BB75C